MILPAWLRAMFGLRATTTIDGVRYTELTAEPLSRALSRRGSREKVYTVEFPRGRRMRIHVTNDRAYADLVPSRLLPKARLAAPLVKPGQRVLLCRCGTGDSADCLVRLVGPSGAVLALDVDEESIRYARWRYGHPNVAYEVGYLDALVGETNGSFDGVVLVDPPTSATPPEDVVREFWRLVGAGGWLMLAGVPSITPHADAATHAMEPDAAPDDKTQAPATTPMQLLSRTAVGRESLTELGPAAVAFRSPKSPPEARSAT